VPVVHRTVQERGVERGDRVLGDGAVDGATASSWVE
jgi:hypothetical protein